MIEQLRKIYSSLIIKKNMPTEESADYRWFITDTNQIIGIGKHELTEKDTLLLKTFLRPYSAVIPEMTAEEKVWETIIAGETHADREAKIIYRLIYFSFSKFQIEPQEFKEAIREFFGKEVPILWQSEHEGIIIEENLEEPISYEQIIDILMSDLYVKIKFLIGPHLHDTNTAKENFQALSKGAEMVFPLSEKDVITYFDAVPYVLLSKTDSNFRNKITNLILGEMSEDTEMLQTIETFISCNLNISVTAKELYLHRNSLQYRLDKFAEKTGLDVRNFHQAVTVYLALLGLKTLKASL
ncbi:PucR family transcriptional regulator [Virgibacillus kekensis]|uniref:PucR family transcriptional regulator n=1 Tax=Virgibacillus kekensis TaxID=202261 RepID=A0ABV9DJZ3_9BACI